MPKIIILSILGFFVLIATGVGFFIIGKSVNNSNQPAPLATVEPTPGPTTGIIQGALSYPSEGIPADMQVCAETLQNQQVKCVQGQNSAYSLELMPGSYYVYAYLSGNPNFKAYYSEFVTCGLMAECPSHAPIEVAVAAEDNILDIDPGDWYNTQ